MSMLNIKNEKLSEALKKLRELYPDVSLGDAIIMAIDRIKKAEEAIKKYSNEAISAKEKHTNSISGIVIFLSKRDSRSRKSKPLRKLSTLCTEQTKSLLS